jgi:hypothetical protein
MERAGLQAGDVVESVDGRPITGAPDWFIARAHVEIARPIELQILRGPQQHVSLHAVVTEPAWRTWSAQQLVGESAFYAVRFGLLCLAIVVSFCRRSGRLEARLLVAGMFAIGAVAEGYPSSGWAAGLHRLPIVLALPIALATASCLLAPVVWFDLFATYPIPWFSKRVRTWLTVAPVLVFGMAVVTSAYAFIYSPSALSQPWDRLDQSALVSAIQNIAGVSPLLFINARPASMPFAEQSLLTLWVAMAATYLIGGLILLAADCFVAREPEVRRRVRVVLAAMLAFALLAVHNVLSRNFPASMPALFSPTASLIADLFFIPVPLILARRVLKDTARVEMEA